MPLPARMMPLASRAPVVLPSLLLCDFGHLAEEIERLEAAGIGAFHLDVMDGDFVPNLTYGMPIVASVRQATQRPLDVHLMISHPSRYLQAFAEAGADSLTVHVEVDEDAGELLRAIRDLGLAAGLALNPATPLSRVEPYLAWCDLVLVMSVPAGFGGQPFDASALDKLSALRAWADAEERILEVDGGINTETIAAAVASGADWLVAGSAIFRSDSYESAVRSLGDQATLSMESRS